MQLRLGISRGNEVWRDRVIDGNLLFEMKNPRRSSENDGGGEVNQELVGPRSTTDPGLTHLRFFTRTCQHRKLAVERPNPLAPGVPVRCAGLRWQQAIEEAQRAEYGLQRGMSRALLLPGSEFPQMGIPSFQQPLELFSIHLARPPITLTGPTA